MKLFLASEGIFEAGKEELANYFTAKIAKPLKGLKVGLIPTAAYPEIIKEWFDITIGSMERHGMEVEVIDLKVENIESLEEKLSNKDVIYVNGGNTFWLLKWVRESGFDKIIQGLTEKDKIYFGVSAGSILAGPNIESAGWDDGGGWGDDNFLNLKDTRGLNLVDFVVYPHFTEEQRKLVESESREVDYKVIPIGDQQMVYVYDNAYKIIGNQNEV